MSLPENLPENLPSDLFTTILSSMQQDTDNVQEAYKGFKEFKGKAGVGLTGQFANRTTTFEDILGVTKEAIQSKADRDLTKPDFGDPVDYVIRTDGACLGNPGPMGLGIAVFSNNGDSYDKGYHLCIDTKEGTNQKAEILAGALGYWIGLHLAKDRKSIRIECDSQYLVETMNGTWSISDPGNARLFMLAGFLRAQYATPPPIFHIYREWNREADYLSNQALGFPDTQLIAPLSVFQSTLSLFQSTLSSYSPPLNPDDLLLRISAPCLRNQLEKAKIPSETIDSILQKILEKSSSTPKQGSRIPAV